MQEVRGSNPRLGGLRVSQFQISGGGKGTLQSRASGLQCTRQGVPSGQKQQSMMQFWALQALHDSSSKRNRAILAFFRLAFLRYVGTLLYYVTLGGVTLCYFTFVYGMLYDITCSATCCYNILYYCIILCYVMLYHVV